MKRFATAFVLLSTVSASLPAENLFRSGNWAALASDRRPEKVGDAITILIAENQQASNSVRQGSKKRSSLDGQIFWGGSFDKSAGASVGGSYEGEGTSARSDRIVAQLSAVVTAIEPNGDLRVSGWQRLRINGELTNIKVAGRIRPQDVTGDNLVLSSRLADATIEYEGRGFASRSAKPGIVSRIFNWLGIL
jgi:flagellar L-ring protein precursor FlgH